MKKYIALFGLIVFALISVNEIAAKDDQNADAILGKWLSEQGDAKIEVYKKNDKYHGKIVWLKEPNRDGKPKTDHLNPDINLRSRKTLGLIILTNFVYDGDFEWEDGEIYDPKSGKTYSCNMELTEKGKVLEIRGYIGISLFGKTTTWTKSD